MKRKPFLLGVKLHPMATQILVVDDDLELRDLLRDYLARQGIEVSVLHDAGSLERRLERERPSVFEEIQSSVADVAGALQSKLGPVSRGHFVAKRVVATQHRQGNLNEDSISEYARFHKLEEVTIGLSLLCELPTDVIERVLLDRNREMLLIVAKVLEFSWDTTMALLFLGAKDHRITTNELNSLEAEFGRLNPETSRSVLQFYQSRKNGDATDPRPKGQAALAVR